MKRRFVVETPTLRGPTKAADILRKRAAGEVSLVVVKALDAAVEGRDAEFCMLVERLLVITLATRMTRGTDAARAQGVLARASAEASPAYVPTTRKDSPLALAHFKEPEA